MYRYVKLTLKKMKLLLLLLNVNDETPYNNMDRLFEVFWYKKTMWGKYLIKKELHKIDDDKCERLANSDEALKYNDNKKMQLAKDKMYKIIESQYGARLYIKEKNNIIRPTTMEEQRGYWYGYDCAEPFNTYSSVMKGYDSDVLTVYSKNDSRTTPCYRIINEYSFVIRIYRKIIETIL